MPNIVDLTISTIFGIALGIEYVAKDIEMEIPNSCLIVDLLIFRILVVFGNEDENY